MTHTHSWPEAEMVNSGRGAQTLGRKPVSGLEGQGLHPELYFLAQAAHGHSKPLDDSHSCPSSKPSTWAPSKCWSITGHTSHMQGKEGGLLGRHSTSLGLSLVGDKVVSSPLRTRPAPRPNSQMLDDPPRIPVRAAEDVPVLGPTSKNLNI